MCYAWESSMNEAKDEGREEGRVEGRVEGREEGKEELMQLFSWLKEAGRLEEAIAIMDQENIDLRNKLFEEFKAN